MLKGINMNIKLASTGLILGALLVPLAGHAEGTMSEKASNAKETTKNVIKDSVITTKIKSAYVKDKTVSAMKVKVETDEKGVVNLSGTAKSQAEIDQAVSIAKGVQGVTEVNNNITLSTKG
jgi:osmotically-inducible protein OsmY